MMSVKRSQSGQTIGLHDVIVEARPEGWVGSQRQARPLEKDWKVKHFLSKDRQGKLSAETEWLATSATMKKYDQYE